tara:strand:- start:59 stop:544 length:486 start_codon:yes stop_codon:yes gene_type:complete
MIYTANTKRNPKHRDPVQDDDLLRLLGEEQKKLPWLPDLLEELQALRNEHRADIQDLMDAYFRVKNRDCDLLDDAYGNGELETEGVREEVERVRDLKETIEMTDFYYQIPWTMFNASETIELRINILKEWRDDIYEDKAEDDHDLFVRKMGKDLSQIEDSH